MVRESPVKLKDVEPIIERLNGVCLQDDLYSMGIQAGIEIAVGFINEAPTILAIEAAYLGIRGEGRNMNHDVAHCFDYDKKKCPKSCFRAQITQEYFEMKAAGRVDFFTTWTHFKDTQYCALVKEEK